MKILFVTSECVPFCKTGGLADVAAALPKKLRQKRHDVRIVLPHYKSVRSREFNVRETDAIVRIPMGPGRVVHGGIRSTKTEEGTPVYFIHQDDYYARMGLYGRAGTEYTDNAERFIFFARAALEACKAMDFRPDIIHCHDWQSALVPVYLKTLLKDDAYFQHTSSVMTIHNIAFQGVFPKAQMEHTGLSWSEFTMDKIEYYDQLSYLKGGIVYADRVNTVSPTYAQEIQTSYEFGRGLEGVLRTHSDKFSGILNGLDQDEWNPEKDPFLARNFDADNLAGRDACKAALQQILKMPVSAETPVLGMVARLDYQKGFDLLLDILPSLLNQRNVQIVILGQGDQALLERLLTLAGQYPGHIRITTDFSEPLAHHIYGGADMFLMPSRFEPCGLSQMISMRYGTLPIVANTGGLHDTVVDASEPSGNGFVFQPGNAAAFLSTILFALDRFANTASWRELQGRAMRQDYSWNTSVQAYLELYRSALGRKARRKKPESSKRTRNSHPPTS